MILRRFTQAFLIIYALLTAYSLISILGGLPYHSFFTPLLTLLAFIFAILHSYQNLGLKQAFVLLGLTFAVSLLFECVGVATGWVYGPYHYTDKLGPKFLGLVPLLIPVAWFMMTYPSYVIARQLVPAIKNTWAWRVLLAGIGALIMTAWDLAMDPLMVAGGHWVWEKQGAYFGVPLHNFAGWWLTIFVTFLLFLLMARIKPEAGAISTSFNRLAMWSYAVTGLSSLLADIEFGLAGPALVGIFVMLPWMLFGISQVNRSLNPS
jgi:carotene biosynthesis associated membrane protein